MLHYPKIPDASAARLGPCIAFDKIDGTNLHFDWHRDFGWHAFGTRRDAFDLTDAGVAAFHAAHPGLDSCVSLFRAVFADALSQVFRAEFADCAELKAFAEYAGPHSFAGHHTPGEAMTLTLFDVAAAGDLVAPGEFVRLFGHLPIPRVVYRGKYSGKLTEDVRRGKYGVREGVVVKGGVGDSLWLCKIKTLAYLDRLKQSFGARWHDYWE